MAQISTIISLGVSRESRKGNAQRAQILKTRKDNILVG